MCFGGSPPAPDTRGQQESLKLQREQLEMAKQQQARQAAQYEEQMRIANAPPPPAPNPVAQAMQPALETPTVEGVAAPTAKGTGRRKMRTDFSGLNIPVV